jgi:hypothetical protein
MDKTAAGVPSTHREKFLHGARGSLRILSQELTLTVAHLQGDQKRAVSVGSRDPDGFFGD